MALHDLTGSVERQEIVGDLGHSLLCLFLNPLPVGAAQAVDLRRVIGDAHIAAEPIRLVDGHVQLVPSSILHQQVLPLAAVEAHLGQSLEEADTVLHMNDIGARFHVGEESPGATGRGRLALRGAGRAQPKISASVNSDKPGAASPC